MRHEFRLDLRLAIGDFQVSKVSRSDHGQWFVSCGPIFIFGQKLQSMAEQVLAPSYGGQVTFAFEDSLGNRWASHPDLEALAQEFWSTTVEFKGKQIPAMPERKAWMTSRAWTICRLECARRDYPDLMGKREVEQIMEDIQMQRPPPVERAFNRLHEAHGYPRLLRFTYETRLDAL